MRIHEIILIPGAGHIGTGSYERGRVHGNLAEVDLVAQYVNALAEELDNSRVRHRIMPTRKAPGLSHPEIAKMLAEASPNVVVLHCSIGWNDAKKTKAAHNISHLTFGEGAQTLAPELGHVIGHWGSLYVHGHKTGLPYADASDTDPLLRIPQTWGLRIEPFQINGPKAADYAQWLPKLGRDIGRFIAEWCLARKDGAVLIPSASPDPRVRTIV